MRPGWLAAADRHLGVTPILKVSERAPGLAPRTPQTPKTRGRKEYAPGKERSWLSLELQCDHFRDADLCPCGESLFHPAGEPFPVQPGAVHAFIHNQKASLGSIAPHSQMLPGHLIVGVQS